MFNYNNDVFSFNRLSPQEYIDNMNEAINMSLIMRNQQNMITMYQRHSNIKKENISIINKTPKTVKTLEISKINKNFYIRLKIISQIAILTSIQFLGQDEDNELLSVSVYNYATFYETSDYDKLKEIFKKGKYIIIINPFYKIYIDGKDGLRIDNPNEIIIFDNKEQCDTYIKKNGLNMDEELNLIEYRKPLYEVLAEIKEIEKRVKKVENNVSLYIKLGEKYLSIKNYPKAEIYANKALKIEPNNKKVYMIKYKRLIELKKYNEALQLINRKECCLSIRKKDQLKKEIKMINDNKKGIFDFSDMIKQEKLNLFVTIGDYVNPKLKKDPDKGIKIITTKAIKKGELIIVSKAICSIPFDQFTSNEENTNNLAASIKYMIENNPNELYFFFI